MSILSFKTVWSLVFTGLRTATFMSSVAIPRRSKEITESPAWLLISVLIKLAVSIWASFTLRPQFLICKILVEDRGLDEHTFFKAWKVKSYGKCVGARKDWPLRDIPSLPPGPGSSQLLLSIYHHHPTLAYCQGFTRCLLIQEPPCKGL